MGFVFVISYQIVKMYDDVQKNKKMTLIQLLSKLSNNTLPIQLKTSMYFSRVDLSPLFGWNSTLNLDLIIFIISIIIENCMKYYYIKYKNFYFIFTIYIY